MKKILFAASEGNPFIKTGGLADVVGALPKYLDGKKFDVRVILPKYLCIPEKDKQKMSHVTEFYADMPRGREYIGIDKVKAEGVTYYFIDNEHYFAGDNPYNQIFEDVNKFAFFSRAVLASLPAIKFCPDIIHCHDWQTALIPVFLKEFYRNDSFFKKTKTVMTIHNQKFQGRWRIDDIENCRDLPAECRYKAMEAYKETNFLKAGILYADRVTTVSETYAEEIKFPEGGEGLEGVMQEVSGKLSGIVNGIDYEEYNSMKDPMLAVPFGLRNIAQKKKNKAMLQKELGLKQDSSVMLIGMVSRLTEQKGFDLVNYVMEEMLTTMNVQVAVLGTGEDRFQNSFRYFQDKYPGQLSATIGYSEERAHKIYGGADVFLMPSQFEPCGLSQLISMCYGTVPIVRETGGLKDTVEAYNEIWQTGTGFSFANYNAKEMLKIIRYAYDVFQNHPKEWKMMMKRCMKADNSWQKSAGKYEKLYLELADC
ncbi:MAG: glycogen synthase GlgA [Lachnospiraceae bacterium]|nr:glycogen synthase GlgA [Lachnospiraceae bacterium]